MRSPLFRRTALWVRQPLDLAVMDEAAQLLVGSQDFCTFGTAPRSTRPTTRQSASRKGGARDRARSVQPTTVRHVVRAVWSRVCEPHPAAHLLTWQRTLLDDTSAGFTSDDTRFPVHDAQWQGLVEFTIEANAFLYHMVRSIVGTLIQVGRGDLSVSEFASALYGADRALAGPTAAPQGLCLIGVRYADAGHRQENK